MKVLDQSMGENYAMYHADCIEGIKGLPDDSIDFSIYSPPFISLYVYSNSDRDLGNSKNDKEFYHHFSFLSGELYRVIKPGRLMAVHCQDVPMMKERDGEIGLKDFPGQLIRMFEKVGFIYHSRITIWKDPVVEVTRTKALGLLHKQLKKDSAMCRVGLPEYLVVMRKPGQNKNPITHTDKEIPVPLWQQWASPVWMDINPSNTLQKESAREEADEKHICPLGLDIIERALVLWSNPGDVVLSPFAGIGSEGYQAVKMGRRFIGFELKESYYRQAVLNLQIAEQMRFQRTLFTVN